MNLNRNNSNEALTRAEEFARQEEAERRQEELEEKLETEGIEARAAKYIFYEI